MKKFLLNTIEKVNKVQCSECEKQFNLEENEFCFYCGNVLEGYPNHTSKIEINYKVIDFKTVEILKPVPKLILSIANTILAILYSPFLLVYLALSALVSKLISIDWISLLIDVTLVSINFFILMQIYESDLIEVILISLPVISLGFLFSVIGVKEDSRQNEIFSKFVIYGICFLILLLLFEDFANIQI